jgi:large subunit ribosomal protein L15
MSGELSRLRMPEGANRPEKRKGKGIAAGQGKTAGRGTKGQKARKSGQVRAGFEGGQMPIQRRLPKTGFINPFTKAWIEVQLRELRVFKDGDVVNEATLRERGIVKGVGDGIKLIGAGELKAKLSVTANRVTKGARAAIEGAGGSISLIADRAKWKRVDSREERRAAKRKG